jgi:hypothetical protein
MAFAAQLRAREIHARNMALLPLLAYPMDEIDPSTRTDVNDGEPRLAKLRVVLHCCKRVPGLSDFVDRPGGSLASLIGAKEASSLLESGSTDKPKCCVVAQSILTLTSDEADDLEDDISRSACVPVQHEDRLALPSHKLLGETSIVVKWAHGVELQILRKSEDAVVFCCNKLSLAAVRLPTQLLDQLFAPVSRAARPPRETAGMSRFLQACVAAFAQNHLRLHALVSAASPSPRLLAFDPMIAQQTEGLQPRFVVTAPLHASAASCLWATQRRDAPQSVALRLEMCGLALDDSSKWGGGGGGCPLHGAKALGHRLVPGICCCCHKVVVECKAGKKVLASIPFHAISNAAWKELTVILAAAKQHTSDDALLRQLEELERDSVRKQASDADLLKYDAIALQLLRDGDVAQLKRNNLATKILTRKRPLSESEKKVAQTHHALFPTQDALAKRHEQPVAPPRILTNSLIEYVDPVGLAEMRRQLAILMQDPGLSYKQKQRGVLFQRFANALDAECGAERLGPMGLPARPLVCTYTNRNDGGRLYPHSTSKLVDQKRGEARSVCIQSAPREMRPFLCCKWGRDYDLVNAQPEILCQMASMLTWKGERAAPKMPQLVSWCKARPAFIDHVAEFHRMPTDADRHPDFRKDLVKELVIRLIFGGEYRFWIMDSLNRNPNTEPKSPRVVALAEELFQLREAVFSSNEWEAFYRRDFARLEKEAEQKEGEQKEAEQKKRSGKRAKKNKDEIDRSIFARIAQRLENDVLTAMRKYLVRNGFNALTLCFDGLIVEERKGKKLDLDALNATILQKTGLRLKVVEKPLFALEYPTLSLARSA